jgi:hypothetical protein
MYENQSTYTEIYVKTIIYECAIVDYTEPLK